MLIWEAATQITRHQKEMNWIRWVVKLDFICGCYSSSFLGLVLVLPFVTEDSPLAVVVVALAAPDGVAARLVDVAPRVVVELEPLPLAVDGFSSALGFPLSVVGREDPRDASDEPEDEPEDVDSLFSASTLCAVATGGFPLTPRPFFSRAAEREAH